jgi:hypothetical protein
LDSARGLCNPPGFRDRLVESVRRWAMMSGIRAQSASRLDRETCGQGSISPRTVLSGESVMLGANLALIVLIGQVPSAESAVLVDRLGSPRYAEREAAADDLERLGRQAIPALRAARDARDLEIRTRALALVNKIEGALLTQPTLVTLDFEDQPLP